MMNFQKFFKVKLASAVERKYTLMGIDWEGREGVIVGFFNTDTVEDTQVSFMPVEDALRDTPSPVAYVNVQGQIVGVPVPVCDLRLVE
jgi:hypothetical protein